MQDGRLDPLYYRGETPADAADVFLVTPVARAPPPFFFQLRQGLIEGTTY
ncbi:MAG: hypothetical protein ACHBMF_08510 [Chromatiales bacterium]